MDQAGERQKNSLNASEGKSLAHLLGLGVVDEKRQLSSAGHIVLGAVGNQQV